MTSERFAQLIVSDEVNTRISGYRKRLPELEELKREAERLRSLIEKESPDDEEGNVSQLKAQLKQVQAKMRSITTLKTGLPTIMYQATFADTTSRRGITGAWRKQAACRLNGLFMLDVDHVDDPKALFASWWQPTKDALLADGNHHMDGEAIAKWAESLGIVLVHITPSGRGLRIVAIASRKTPLPSKGRGRGGVSNIPANEE
nr:hypothetical protein [Prevotella sp.]